jgi:hypothetical protein
MKRWMLSLGLALPAAAIAQNTDSLILKSISDQIMLHGQCYEDLRTLTKDIGHRLSGTPEARQAVAWAEKTLRQAGADTVWLQPVMVPHWVRGPEKLEIKMNGREFTEMALLSLGNTDGTGGSSLEGTILYTPDLQSFEALPDDIVKDKIVFFDYHFRQDIINTFHGYGDAVIYRWQAVNAASRKGAAAVIIRSVSTAPDDKPHAGSSHYADSVRHIPAVAIGNLSADRLAAACKAGKPVARLVSNCHFEDPVLSYNVIGELKGTEKPGTYMVVGGHLDSWDVGEGAQDDGAGIVQSIEVLRSLKQLGLRPKHTLRVVCFMNEENGAKGGRAYADSARNRKESHIFALESDAGGFVPRSMGLVMPPAQRQLVKSWQPLFVPYGVYDFDQDEGGVDISFLEKLGVPLAGLLPDPQRYFDLHHSANDVFEAVSHRELKLGAWTMTAMIYLVDKYF